MERRQLLIVLSVALPLGACGSESGSPPTAATTQSPDSPTSSSSPTPAPMTLVFSDTFDRRDLGNEWLAGAACDPASGGPPGEGLDEASIVLIGGRVRATGNCNYIETQASFGGDVQVVFDVEKVGADTYPCWDYFVELRGTPAAAGSILFDYDGRDAVHLGPGCADGMAIEGESPNSGSAVLTLSAGTIGFVFTNSNAETLDAGTATVGSVSSARVRIWLAGLESSPRYVDNVRIFASTTTAASVSTTP